MSAAQRTGGEAVCSSCGASNKAGRPFCTRCGATLKVACDDCGTPLEPGDAFCGSCGRAVARPSTESPLSVAGSAPPATERRIVSVMFADLVGFTAYSEGRDPEEVRATLSRYFEAAREIVDRYDGVIEKFIGDAVMAVWGTPVAREDDTERSVRAGLDMVDAIDAIGRSIGAELSGRVGIHSGEAAVNLRAADQGMVAGDMVNTAARLQGAAAPGTVLVDRTTFFGANEAIAFSDAGSLTLKGKQDPVDAWQALRVVGGRRGFGTGMLEPPFTGRQEELRAIKDMLHATGRERRPRLAAMVGIGGIGKSRLVWELYKYVDGLSEEVLWHSGRSPAYGEGVAFWPLAEMVRTRALVAESDDPETARSKVASCVERFVVDPEERSWVEPRIMHLLGLEEREEDQREVLFAAWRTFFERLADTETCVMVFEDLQWADGGLIDFIEHLVEWARNSPIFVLTLSRPELHDRRPTWGSRSRHFSSLHLEALNDDDMRLLLKGLAPELPEDIGRQIVARAEGIPLYAVEMVRMLIDRGDLVESDQVYAPTRPITGIEVPDTLHSLIAARLDVLPEMDRKVVQHASVLGKTFAAPGLTALLDGAEDLEARLRELVRREILTFNTDPRSPERGQYGFVQSLIREVAYQTMANADRGRLHLRAAAYYESLNDPELVDVIATHYVEAHRFAPSDEVADKARVWLIDAADRAASLGSPEQGQSLIETAIDITAPGRERGELLHRAGELANAAGRTDAATSHFQRSIEELHGHPELVTQVQISMGVAYFLAGRLDEGRDLLEGALAQIEDPSSDPAAADIYSQLARLYTFQGRWDIADDYCRRALVTAEHHERVATVVDALITRGVLAIFGGRPHEAEALLEGGLKLAQKNEMVAHQTRALVNLSANQAETDPRDSMASARAGLDIARRYGFRDGEAFLLSNAGEAALHLGDFTWIDVMEEFLQNEIAASARLGVVAALSQLHAFAGDGEKAHLRLQESERLKETTTNLQDTVALAQSSALIAIAENRPQEAWDRTRVEVPAGFKLPGEMYMTAGRAGLWLGDADKMRETIAGMTASGLRGPMFSRRRATLEAGLAALEGRTDAPDLYLDAAHRWLDRGTPWDLALCRLDMAIALDGDEATRAAEEAAAFFDQSGCVILAERARAAAS